MHGLPPQTEIHTMISRIERVLRWYVGLHFVIAGVFWIFTMMDQYPPLDVGNLTEGLSTLVDLLGLLGLVLPAISIAILAASWRGGWKWFRLGVVDLLTSGLHLCACFIMSMR